MLRVRHAHRRRGPLLRWLGAVVSVLLVIGLLGQGHTFQTLGIAVACTHPAATALADAHDDGDGGSHSDCPPDCHDCACGHVPMTLPLVEPPALCVLLAAFELDELAPPETPGRAALGRLERPPRQPRA
ncbi:hypothetical protein WME76_07965 [Sorangium sp. So ce119]|uniref:hypothetical protein n=1 Tax=Sorangium sp. So ce119 TaxID=3133279 RepID=UPI003F5FE54E